MLWLGDAVFTVYLKVNALFSVNKRIEKKFMSDKLICNRFTYFFYTSINGRIF